MYVFDGFVPQQEGISASGVRRGAYWLAMFILLTIVP